MPNSFDPYIASYFWGRSELRVSWTRLSGCVSLCALCACTTIDVTKEETSANYFGWVRITRSLSDESLPSRISAFDTKVVGVRVEDGVTVGYSDWHRYDIPLDCRLVIFVQDKDQLDFVSRQITNFKEGICAAQKQP